jgi:hypothetical protein
MYEASGGGLERFIALLAESVPNETKTSSLLLTHDTLRGEGPLSLFFGNLSKIEVIVEGKEIL